ncbi:MAG: hypothetical protein QXH05_03675 [Thermosphaera sp.]
MGLARYVLVRGLLIIPTILVLYTLVFIALRILPGNPVLAALGTKNIPEEQLTAIMKELGLDNHYTSSTLSTCSTFSGEIWVSQ